MGDYGKFKVGNVVYPLDPALYLNPLGAIDPAKDQGLSYFTAMLQVHMGDLFDAVVTDIGRPEFVDKVVAYTLPYDPMPYYKEQQAKFPLLALWETESNTSERTFSWYNTVSIWKVAYSLFPTTSSEAEKMYPFLRAARDIIIDRAEQGYDPNYNNSQEVWSDGYSGLAKLKTTRSLFKNLTTDPRTNIFFPTVELTMEVTFQESFQRNFLEEFGGVDTTQLLDGYQFLQTSQDNL